MLVDSTQSLDDVAGINKVFISCDVCGVQKWRRKRDILYTRKNNDGSDLCVSCSAKKRVDKSPQCSSHYWTEEKRKEHGGRVRSSQEYYNGIKTRDQHGPKNGMYGKIHSKNTKMKMSKVRTGKIGPNATAWKGGKQRLTLRVKKCIETRFQWFSRIKTRDVSCQKCGEKKHLDCHHIVPISKIIKKLLKNTTMKTDNEKLEWLLTQPEISDINLENGILLCRTCHKKEHLKWGSHDARSIR